MTDQDTTVDTAGLGSVEAPVLRYLELLRRERSLEKRLTAVRAELEKMKRDSKLMTICGDIGRLQRKRDDPRGFAELEAARKRKAAAKVALGTGTTPDSTEKPSGEAARKRIPKKPPGSAQERLAKKLKGGAVAVDKSLQKDAEKK